MQLKPDKMSEDSFVFFNNEVKFDSHGNFIVSQQQTDMLRGLQKAYSLLHLVVVSHKHIDYKLVHENEVHTCTRTFTKLT